MHLIVLTRNNIHACQVLGRLIIALEVDLEIFDEVLKPLFDAESSENIIKPNFNLDDDSLIQRTAIVNLDSE